MISYCDVLDGDRIVGQPLALGRYRNYRGRVIWYFHSEYRGHYIFNAKLANGDNCGLYSIVTKTERLVGATLSGIKNELKIYLGAGL